MDLRERRIPYDGDGRKLLERKDGSLLVLLTSFYLFEDFQNYAGEKTTSPPFHIGYQNPKHSQNRTTSKACITNLLIICCVRQGLVRPSGPSQFSVRSPACTQRVDHPACCVQLLFQSTSWAQKCYYPPTSAQEPVCSADRALKLDNTAAAAVAPPALLTHHCVHYEGYGIPLSPPSTAAVPPALAATAST